MKVITGKTVTNWKETTVTSVAGLADKTSGVYYIAVGAINMQDKTAKSDASAYGFITSSISTSKEGSTTYKLFTMWDGTKSVDVKVDKDDVKVNLDKYNFVSFDWEVEPAGETAGEADGSSLIVKTAAANATAITAFVNNDSITFSDGTSLDFADTYFVIGVDTKAGEGSSAKLATAKEQPGNKNMLCANAVYFVVKDGDDDVIEAVFVDAAGVMSKTDKADNEIYVAGPKTTTSATTFDEVKALNDGVYVPTQIIGDMAGNAKDNVIFKFTAPANSEAYTLSIKNSAGKEVYKETSTLSKGAHCFYITTKANNSAQNAGEGTYKASAFAAGTYSFSITGATSGVVLNGAFTIA